MVLHITHYIIHRVMVDLTKEKKTRQKKWFGLFKC